MASWKQGNRGNPENQKNQMGGSGFENSDWSYDTGILVDSDRDAKVF